MASRAFELVPAIERSLLNPTGKPGSNTNTAEFEICSMDCCIRHIFLGTSNGLVMHYTLEEKSKTAGRITYVCHLQGKRTIIQKRPITHMKFISSVDKLAVLIDGLVHVYDALRLDPSSHEKIKNVNSFSVDEEADRNNPFSQQVCCALKRKCIQMFSITAEKWIHLRDIAVPELPLLVALDGTVVCVALTNRYLLIHTDTTKVVDLFSFDREQDTPFIKRTTKDEFFLGGPGNLGVFVTSSGFTLRPPIQLKENVLSLAFSSPYLVSLNNQFLVAHSLIDQQQKQATPFQRGVSLKEFGDRILIASAHEVFALVPVHWEKQVQMLLADHKTDEAIMLAQDASRTSGLSKEQFNKIFSRIQQQAGFVELSALNLEAAREYFTAGQVDPREVISLFPSFHPADHDFVRSRPALHELADINQITNNDPRKMKDCKAFLASFLTSYRYPLNLRKEVHTALIKLFAEDSPTQLRQLIEKGCQAPAADVHASLSAHSRFHCLALYYKQNNEIFKSLDIWARLLTGELNDEEFSSLGLPFFAHILSSIEDCGQLFQYASLVLEKDQALGAKIFTQRSKSGTDDRLSPASVTEYLLRFPTALRFYLEYIVFERKLKNEQHHSHLAMVYLDELVSLKTHGDTPAFTTVRKKLQTFLSQSDMYSVNLILGRVEREDWLLHETAILYGKTGQHQRALDVLANKLQDYKAAETYCITHSRGQPSSVRHKLFEQLLTIYLEKAGKDERFRIPAIDLLNSSNASFNVAKAAALVPEEWSIALLSQFLLNSVRSSLHEGRQMRIACQLSCMDRFAVQMDLVKLQEERIILTDTKRCDLCHQLFKDYSCTRLPTGEVAHITCFKAPANHTPS